MKRREGFFARLWRFIRPIVVAGLIWLTTVAVPWVLERLREYLERYDTY